MLFVIISRDNIVGTNGKVSRRGQLVELTELRAGHLLKSYPGCIERHEPDAPVEPVRTPQAPAEAAAPPKPSLALAAAPVAPSAASAPAALRAKAEEAGLVAALLDTLKPRACIALARRLGFKGRRGADALEHLRGLEPERVLLAAEADG